MLSCNAVCRMGMKKIKNPPPPKKKDGEGWLLDHDLTVMSSTRSRYETVPVTKTENITGIEEGRAVSKSTH
jgi:hypothetical protein